MIDIHSHLIPNVDDGSRSVEATFEMFEEAEKAGFTDIILTSHYITNAYETNAEELVFWKDKLQEILIAKNKKLKLHSGMEIYISDQIDKLMKENKLLTLANSRYILIELPMNTNINYLDYVIYFLDTIGAKFVLAHPERYRSVQENPGLVEEYIKKGCLMQCNYGSILGIYGKQAKNTIKYLLKKNLVHFIASDCHKKGSIYVEVPKALKKIEKIIGTEKTYKITTLNQQKILNNEEW